MIYHVTVHFDGMTFERDFYTLARAQRWGTYQANRLQPAPMPRYLFHAPTSFAKPCFQNAMIPSTIYRYDLGNSRLNIKPA
jgi:hypothetical protein